MIGTLVGVLMTLIGGEPDVVYAQEEVIERKVVLIEEHIDWNEDRIKQEIKEQSEKYNVSYDEMYRVIQCESHGSTTIQSYHKRPDGTREQSFGLAQFHIPAGNKTESGEVITEEMAKDPKIAISTMAYYFSLGEKYKQKWSCY